jgi:hypothetical protein
MLRKIGHRSSEKEHAPLKKKVERNPFHSNGMRSKPRGLPLGPDADHNAAATHATMTEILIRHDDLARFIAAIFGAKGMSAEDAATVAEGLVLANLRGTDGHGVVRLPTYLDFIDRGQLDPRARPKPRAIGPSAIVLDCARAAGPVAILARSAAIRNGWQSRAAPH